MVTIDGHPKMTSLGGSHELTGEGLGDRTDSHQPSQSAVEVVVYSARQGTAHLVPNMSLLPMAWHGCRARNRSVYTLGPRGDHVGSTAIYLIQRAGCRSSPQAQVHRSAGLWTKSTHPFPGVVL